MNQINILFRKFMSVLTILALMGGLSSISLCKGILKQTGDNDITTSLYKVYEDNFRIGVAVSKSPASHFKAEVEDTDGKFYMYFGGIWGGQLQRWHKGYYDVTGKEPEDSEPAMGPRIARLSNNMLIPLVVLFYLGKGEKDMHHLRDTQMVIFPTFLTFFFTLLFNYSIMLFFYAGLICLIFIHNFIAIYEEV